MTKKSELILKISASFCVAAFIAGSATYCFKAIKTQQEFEEQNGVGGLESSSGGDGIGNDLGDKITE